jgi:plastocyanin
MAIRRSPRVLVLPVLAAAAVALALALGGCGGGSSPSATEPGVVEVKDDHFTPATVEVHVGDTVTWRWVGRADHNVVGPGFTSPIQGKGSTFRHRFTEAGTVDYICTIHYGMKAKVKVVAG